MTPLAPALQAWFTDRLITQRNSSPQTIAAYRDTFKLLLAFAHAQTGKQPFELDPALKEQAIARTAPLGTKPGRYRPSDPVLAWLQTL